MSKLLLLFAFVFATVIVGCSSSGENSADEVESEWGGDEFEDDSIADDLSDDFDDEFGEDDDRSPSSVGSLNIDEQQEYKVKKGDTLMQISFKLFGDISKWKVIADLNPGAEQLLISGSKNKSSRRRKSFCLATRRVTVLFSQEIHLGLYPKTSMELLQSGEKFTITISLL